MMDFFALAKENARAEMNRRVMPDRRTHVPSVLVERPQGSTSYADAIAEKRDDGTLTISALSGYIFDVLRPDAWVRCVTRDGYGVLLADWHSLPGQEAAERERRTA